MRRFSPILALVTLMLVACGPSGDRAAVERYLADAEPVATDLSETGSRFEKLMNAQADGIDWTTEENNELNDVLADIEALKVKAEGISVPAEIKDIHPLLPKAVSKMIEAMKIVQDIVKDPANADESQLNQAVAKTEEGGTLAQQYVDQLGALLEDRYPDLLKP